MPYPLHHRATIAGYCVVNALQCSGRVSRANSVDGEDDDAKFDSRPTVASVMAATGLNLFNDPLFVVPFFTNLFACTGLFIPFVFIVKTAESHGIDEQSAVFLLSVIGSSITFPASRLRRREMYCGSS